MSKLILLEEFSQIEIFEPQKCPKYNCLSQLVVLTYETDNNLGKHETILTIITIVNDKRITRSFYGIIQVS